MRNLARLLSSCLELIIYCLFFLFVYYHQNSIRVGNVRLLLTSIHRYQLTPQLQKHSTTKPPQGTSRMQHFRHNTSIIDIRQKESTLQDHYTHTNITHTFSHFLHSHKTRFFTLHSSISVTHTFFFSVISVYHTICKIWKQNNHCVTRQSLGSFSSVETQLLDLSAVAFRISISTPTSK
uniref:Uncharacterized protein n=1 Tax=Physcomitrium patens TaxID=3218 RepID=A0A2K1JU88_PHYPA|nr:hypothetical protein PHYPA_014858 [Physcomitrium patens]